MLSAWCRHCRRLSEDRVETVLHSVGATVLPSIFITLEHVGDYLARPAAESRHGGQYVLLLFIYSFIYLFFNDSCRTNYLKIYQTDLCQMLQVR